MQCVRCPSPASLLSLALGIAAMSAYDATDKPGWEHGWVDTPGQDTPGHALLAVPVVGLLSGCSPCVLPS
jgi:hypothetical protein